MTIGINAPVYENNGNPQIINDDGWSLVQNQIIKGDPALFNRTKDDNALGFLNSEYVRVRNCVLDANGVAEALKLSRCKNVIIENCDIIGGYEDIIDMVGCTDVRVVRCNLWNPVNSDTISRVGVTIKGGCSRIVFEHCWFRGSGFTWGPVFDLGGHTIYDEGLGGWVKTREVVLKNLVIENRCKFLVRVLWATTPFVSGTRVSPSWFRILSVPKFIVYPVFWFNNLKKALGLLTP